MTIQEINARIGRLLAADEKKAEALLNGYEKRLLNTYRDGLKEIKSLIAAMYERYGKEVKYHDMMAYNRLANLELQITGLIKEISAQNLKTTTKALKDMYELSYYRSGYAYESSIGARLGFGTVNPDMIKAALINPMDRIKWQKRLGESAAKYDTQLRSELTQGLLQGKGYAKIASAFTEKTKIDIFRTTRIMRTEGHRVQSAANLLAEDRVERAAGDLGIEMVKVWLATLDGRTRDSHRQMDGQEADENGMFHFPGGGTTEGPGLSGIAEEDINCRCTTISQLKEFKQQFRKDNINKEIIQNVPYSEWEKLKGIAA